MDKTKSEQMEKARLGAVGEHNVVSILMQKGWDAFNANCSIKNYKSIDIVCLDSGRSESIESPWKPKTVLIQVKTSRQNNIPIGFNIKQCLDRVYLEQNVKGPYVFVFVKEEGDKYSFRYFILSRKQFIELAYSAHKHYDEGYKREKELNKEALAGLKLKWLEGEGEKATGNHIAYNNPLNGVSCENCWNNIWEE
jgi:hypothetical protein